MPVAAGLGGGSADAAAVLRLAAGEVADLSGLAAGLGADVPSQLRPRRWRWSRGAGERVEPLPEPAPHAAVLLCPTAAASAPPTSSPRPTGSGSAAAPEELEALAQRLLTAAGAGASPLAYPELLVNDLEPAARSLRPAIGDALDALREAGAAVALLSGSGPTAVGLFADLAAARAAAETIDRDDAIVCEPARGAMKLPGEKAGRRQPQTAAAGGRRRRGRLRLLPAEPEARPPRPPEAARRRLQHARRLDLPAGRRLRLRRDRRLRRPRRPRRDGDAARRRRRRPGRDRHLPADRDRLVLGLGGRHDQLLHRPPPRPRVRDPPRAPGRDQPRALRAGRGLLLPPRRQDDLHRPLHQPGARLRALHRRQLGHALPRLRPLQRPRHRALGQRPHPGRLLLLAQHRDRRQVRRQRRLPARRP